MEPFLNLIRLLSLSFIIIKISDYYLARKKRGVKTLPDGISNDKLKSINLLDHYYAVLLLDPSVAINTKMVEQHYLDRLTELVNSDLTESIYQEKHQELEAAQSYLQDYIKYLAYKN